jgi:hypothetical protein
MIRAVLFASAVVMAAACTPPAETPAPTPEEVVAAMPQNADDATAQDTCGAAAFQGAIGSLASELTLPESARVIGPDTIVTQDFVPERLNVITDAAGRVTELRCY